MSYKQRLMYGKTLDALDSGGGYLPGADTEADELDDLGDELDDLGDADDDLEDGLDDDPEKNALLERIEELSRQNSMSNNIFESAVKGSINPFNNQPIETPEDYLKYEEMFRAEQLKAAGLEPDYIDKTIENHPAIIQAKQYIEMQEANRIKSVFDKELLNIQKINPDIKSLDDLKTIEGSDILMTLVKGGKHIDEAYSIVAKLSPKESKPDEIGNFLNPSGNGSGASALPGDVKRLYKTLNPKATDEEIIKHWEKSKRR